MAIGRYFCCVLSVGETHGGSLTPYLDQSFSGTEPANLSVVTTEAPWSAEEHERALDELAGRENFPVATRLLPRRHRADLRAVYGFARLVDDIGDKAPRAQRAALLDSVDSDLDLVFTGRTPDLPQLRRLAGTIRTNGIPQEPFR